MSNWFKGNIHTHTTKSDGDADPEVVVKWFMEHGYDFLVLSDHNHRTILDHEVEGGPLMVPGEEVSRPESRPAPSQSTSTASELQESSSRITATRSSTRYRAT